MTVLPLRQELVQEETWDLSLLFADQTAFETAMAELKEQADHFVTYKGRLDQKDILLSALEAYEKLSILATRVFHYASLAYEVDKLSEVNEQNQAAVDHLEEYVGQKTSFFLPELGQLEAEYLTDLMADSQGQPFRFFLEEVVRTKQTRLAGPVEEALSALSGSIYSNYKAYLNTKFQDLSFDDFQANGQTYGNSFVGFEGDYEAHPDKEVRRAAWQSFHQGLAKYQHTFALNYIQHVQTEKKMATLRGFDSVIDYLLFDQKVTREAYNRQIDVIMKELSPVMQRYAKLLAKAHQISDMSLADIKIAYSAADTKKVSIAETQDLIESCFAVFGQEYSQIVHRSFAERWIDYPMNQTKSTGGFNATIYDGPSYTLLNWTGLLNEVLTLAHELGHAAHFELTYDNQLCITPETSLYFVEAPSTANEVIMCQYLLQQPLTASQKQNLLAGFIANTYFHNMVTHLLEAAFQRKVYEAVDRQQALNAKKLNQFFKEVLEEFWGDAVIVNEGAELTWMRQPHYFLGLYSYTYSAGLTIGTQVGQEVAKGNQDTIQRWIDALKAGGSLSPLELADKAGVSMHDDQALKAAIAYVDHLIDQIEELND
ncbi:oligoendopeptidase F [Vaginisenegalia massiliensis]|uniref:oligoendopeptidase F n=1 Tax=Vaginisenegalia massiliensis TaxID=2058294 RepID=UPI000F5419DC|nr:oligoendopeptidase F [Vaginisenegalia massiliensis]